MTRHPALRSHAVRALACLISILVCAVTASSPARAEAHGWTLPLAGPPVVVRGFQPPAEPWLVGHRGVDLRGSPGDPVLSAGPGRVSFAGSVAGKPVVVVTHPSGLRTTYEPVIRAVGTGDEVTTGSLLGRLVAVGGHCLPATCLHWGLRRGDSYLDPLSLVGATLRVRLLPVWSRGSSVAAAPRARGFALAAHVGALNRMRAAAGLAE
jgi:murein DD-endopeptidase MepM/ murein hydrolase activator NlpD